MTPTGGIVLHAPAPDSVRLIACSPPSWMVALALLEKGLSYQQHLLDFAKGEHRTPEMLRLNPRGTVPVLSDGEAHVHETFAILAYLEWAYPKPPLLPAQPVARGRALSRLHESGELKRAGMALFAYLMHTPAPEIDADRLKLLKAALHRELAAWNGYYVVLDWVAGDQLSLADLSVFVYLATAVHLGLRFTSEDYGLERFYLRMRDRDSVARTWPSGWNGQQHDHLSDLV